MHRSDRAVPIFSDLHMREISGFTLIHGMWPPDHQHYIRILPGDRVLVELSEYDLTRGRVTYRFKS